MPVPAFVADAMLGRLARWLRTLGADTLYEPALDDHALVALADAESRVLLTRDRHLLRELRPARALEITHDEPLAQLRLVADAGLLAPPAELFTRCLVCNGELRVVPEAEARPLLPPAACGLPGPVRRCAACGRVYWQGSHARRMRGALAAAFPEWFG